MQTRIDKLLSTISDEAVLITGKANIFYYSGFRSEDSYLLISKNSRIIVTDSRYTIQAREQAPDFELCDITLGTEKIFERISEENILFEEDCITAGRLEKFKNAAPKKTFTAAQKTINVPRYVKDKSEIKKIAEAEKIGDDAFSYILDFIRVGKTEREIALELEFFMKKQGAQALSFDTIAASGKRSAMPHGLASDKTLENGDFLTLDFGCIFEGYCSDMTRTVVVGKADEKQKEIYNIVLSAQENALLAISPGKKCADIDSTARSVIERAGYGRNFGHSLGHSAGIEIHENPVFSPKSMDITEVGHVITVEPGIYIDNFGGVRIEDLVAVTKDGIVNLTHSPKELLEL